MARSKLAFALDLCAYSRQCSGVDVIRSSPRRSGLFCVPQFSWQRGSLVEAAVGSVRCWRRTATRTGRLGHRPRNLCSLRQTIRSESTPSLRVFSSTIFLPVLVADRDHLDGAEQLRSCLHQLDSWLSSYEDYEIASVRVFVAPGQEQGPIQRVYEQWSNDHDQAPTVTWLEVRPLAPGRDVLIEAVAGQQQQQQQVAGWRVPQTVTTMQAAQAVGPYVQAVKLPSSATVYVSGCIGLRPPPHNDLVGPDIESQTIQALSNMKAILNAAGSNVPNVMKVMILLDDMGDFATVNRIYEAWLREGGCTADRLPARSTFAVKTLPKGAKVEIECIACCGEA
ncbi:hypothetical protein CCYA_CCYA04G1344 [Cyanidiococcus yangmingshanensis]|nr:hypothetical protein CCYA_CCYA04G1344 [Cyanidiococcus yangmingshanensis]